MFFKNLILANPWWTEFFLYAYTLFTLVLSVYVMGYHGKLSWWDENCDSASNEEKDKNKPDSFGNILAILFIVALCLMSVYALYTFFTFGTVAGQKIEGVDGQALGRQLQQQARSLGQQARTGINQLRQRN